MPVKDRPYARSPQEVAREKANETSGHTIKSSTKTMTARKYLKFTGSCTVTDDGTNTVVNMTGGGSTGNSYFPSGW